MPDTSHQHDHIRVEIEKALQTIAPELANKVRGILFANLDRGRVETFLAGDPSRVGEYVERVLGFYSRLSPYLHALQSERGEDAWQPLFKKLRTWAYNFLLRKNFYPGPETLAMADECAAEAALHILNAHFPYDTEFEPWAYTIVTMTCLHFFRDGTKKSVIPPQNLVELDEQLPDLADLLTSRDDRDDLTEAMSGLAEARRSVIQLHYFKGLSLPEIATTMGKSVGAIHSLHFNALADLRKILVKNRNNT